MWQLRGFKGIALLGVLVLAIAAIGGMILSKVRAEDRADQQAWQQVLDSDFQSSVQAKQALRLVASLEKLQQKYPDGGPEVDAVEQRIAAAWPDFGTRDGAGRLVLPPTRAMRRALEKYAAHG
jgi:hypothetical protein